MKTLEKCKTCNQAESWHTALFCKLTGKKCTVKDMYVDDDCVNYGVKPK